MKTFEQFTETRKINEAPIIADGKDIAKVLLKSKKTVGHLGEVAVEQVAAELARTNGLTTQKVKQIVKAQSKTFEQYLR